MSGSAEGRSPTFDEVVLGRRSIRGYRREPAPKALIREVIEMATVFVGFDDEG